MWEDLSLEENNEKINMNKFFRLKVKISIKT